MNKIICNSVDFVFRHEIITMIQGEAPVLTDTAGWKKIDVSEKPVYQSIIKRNDAGATNEETVTAKERRKTLYATFMHCYYIILRMSTNSETFYVGNLDYPCEVEISSDKIFDNYTFKAVSPA